MTTDSTIAKPAPAVSLQALGIFLALLGAALFATKGIIIKLALADNIDTLTTLAWRQIMAVPVFVTVGILGYMRKRRDAPAGAAPILDAKTLFQALGVGMLGYYVASLLDFSALTYITAQLDRLILLTYPFFVVAFGLLFFRRKVTWLMGVSLIVSYAGIVIIFARDFSVEGDNVVLGSLLVFGSAFAYAGYQVLAKPLIDRLGAQLFTSIAMSGAGPAVLVHFLATHPVGALAINGHGIWLMLRHRARGDGRARLLHLGRHRAHRPRANRHYRQRLTAGDRRSVDRHPRRSLHGVACPRHRAGAARRLALRPQGKAEAGLGFGRVVGGEHRIDHRFEWSEVVRVRRPEDGPIGAMVGVTEGVPQIADLSPWDV